MSFTIDIPEVTARILDVYTDGEFLNGLTSLSDNYNCAGYQKYTANRGTSGTDVDTSAMRI